MRRSALSRRASFVLAGVLIAALAPTAQALPTPSPAGSGGTPTTATPPDPVVGGLRTPEVVGSSRITSSSSDPTEQVDPLMGTSNAGNVFPGAVVPFGMLSFSPETSRGNAYRTAAPGGYLYTPAKIRGFSLTHMSGTGCAGGSGDIPIFPYAGEVTTSPQSGREGRSLRQHVHPRQRGRQARLLQGRARLRRHGRARRDHAHRVGRRSPSRRTSRRRCCSAPRTPRSAAATREVRSTRRNRTVSGSVTSGNFCGYMASVGQRSYYTLHFVAEFDQPFAKTGHLDRQHRHARGALSATGRHDVRDRRVDAAEQGLRRLRRLRRQDQVNVRIGISYVSRPTPRRT